MDENPQPYNQVPVSLLSDYGNSQSTITEHEKSPEEVFDELIEDNDKLRDSYNSLRKHNVPKPEAIRAIKEKFTSKPDQWDQYTVPDSPPPSYVNKNKIADCDREAQLGREMQGESQYVTYFIECELLGGPLLRQTKSTARDLLPSVAGCPDWLYYAWKADNIYYVGQTSDFGIRLDAHCNNVRDNSNSAHQPAMLTAISDVKRAGVINRVRKRCAAEKLEEWIAKKWSTEDNRRFVYYA